MPVANILLTFSQALQLVALAPCLFIVLFLLTHVKHQKTALLPILYFTVLACIFLSPLVSLIPEGALQGARVFLEGGLLFVQTLLPALSFLLIVQFHIGRIPSLWYWAILAMPILGGSPMVYATFLAHEVCIPNWGCMAPAVVHSLYETISTAVIFLLLVVEFNRGQREKTHHEQVHHRSHKYWLIVALISLNLLLLAVELARLAEKMNSTDALFISTMVRMTFIYLVLTLLFRLFEPPGAKKPSTLNDKELLLAETFRGWMQNDKMYRDVHCTREMLARKLGVNENYLSRIVNLTFQKRLTDVINHYRVEDAKERLAGDKGVPITTIAFEVGFNSIASFNRVFKELVGKTPSEFRNAAA